MEEKKEWKKKIPMWIKEGLFEEVTDDRGTRILGYVNCSDKVLDFIEQEIDKAREEGRDEIINRIDKTKIPKRFWNKEVYLGLIKWWEKEKIKLSKLKGEK